jgi:signal transduction histidine kinase
MNAYDEAAGNLRKFSALLRPGVLEFGLGQALHELTADLSDIHPGLSIRVDLPHETPRYPTNIESNAYRIIQQLIDNAIQHARTSNIVVSGDATRAGFSIVVSDDGIGFDYSKLDLSTLLINKHYGLVGILERASLINAALDFHSQSGKGTRAVLTWENGGTGDAGI